MKEEHFDVVIVGGGGAGLAAAVSAADAARTVVLEKGDRLCGTTGISVGSITASATRRQKSLGIEDSPDEHLQDYLLMAGQKSARDNAELSRLLVENVGRTVDWLEELGVVFFGPMQEPPHRKPRMHNVLPSSRSYIHHLAKAARAKGAEIRLRTTADRLVMDDGRVAAVEVVSATGARIRYNARRGVVLAGGDFSNDRQFRIEHYGAGSVDYEAANRLATGDTQRMAMQLGATICNADLFDGPQMRFPPPPRDSWLLRLPPVGIVARPMRWALQRLPGRLVRPFALQFVTTYLAPDARLFASGALFLDQDGADLGQAVAPGAVVKGNGKPAYVVMDAALYRRFCSYPNYIATAPNVAFAYADDFRRNRPDIFFTARTLERLGGATGIAAEKLIGAVAAHNRAAAGRRDVAPLAEPPFMALGPVMPYILTTHGGLRISNRLEVIGGDGRPIPGLFAAGSAGRGGVLLPGHGHSLGWAFTSGRLAGSHAAETGLQRPKVEW